MLPPGIVLVSAVLDVLSFVLILLLLASAGGDYDTLVRINWAEAVNQKVVTTNDTVNWCTNFYDRQLCLGMEFDVHLGAQRIASRTTVRSAVAVITDDKNVTSYSTRCQVPNGGGTCGGCANASDVVTTFLVLTFLANLAALVAHYLQLQHAGATRPTRVVIAASSVVIGLSAIVMIATFEEDCFKKIPSTLSPKHGACYVFAAFIFMIALGEGALQAAVTETSGTGTASVFGGGVEAKAARKEARKERAQSRASQARPAPPPHRVSTSRMSSKVAPTTAAIPAERPARKASKESLGAARRVSVNASSDDEAQHGAIHAKFARRGSSSIAENLEGQIAAELQQP